MKYLHRLLHGLLVFSLLFSLFQPLVLFADTDDLPFDPNFIISDEEIQHWQSMTRVDIQTFLEEQGGYIARLTTNDASGTPRVVSDIISRAATQYRINPKYLLVKLQKEQSLVTDPSPTQKQLDWATGYGVCDGCSMNDHAIQKHRGLGTQIDAAAGVIRWYYDNVLISPIIKRPNVSYTIDGTRVIPTNYATAFLYTYTPHIHGNKNFWTLWQKWFENMYPDGTLVRVTDNPTVYLIDGGQKRPFGNMAALTSRFSEKNIVTIPETELARYELGRAITLPNYSLLRESGVHYLLDNDTLRPFADGGVVAKLGYNPDEVIDVTSEDIAGLKRGETITVDRTHPLGRLARIRENKQLYYILDGVSHAVSDSVIAKDRFPNLTIEDLSVTSIGDITPGNPLLFKDGTLIGTKSNGKIYVVEHGRKRHIPDELTFSNLGYRLDTVHWTDDFTAMNHPTGQPLATPHTVLIASRAAAPKPPVVYPPTMVHVAGEDASFAGEKFDTLVDTYIVADADTGAILAGKNIDTVRPMASFAKVMTAYRLIMEGLPLYRVSTYDPKEHKAPYHNFRIAAGEMIRNEDLMEALLVSSLNTPANMLISHIEKRRDQFVKRMNDTAKEWGLTHTTFADATGESVDTKTTAREYLSLYQKTTLNLELQRIMGMREYRYNEVVDKDGKPAHYDTHSNELAARTDLPFVILTSKTGYLDEAGHGLAMTIERPRDKKRFIILTMGNPDSADRFAEPERLARWVIARF